MIKVPLKAKHFENASYVNPKDCPIARALREYFNTPHASEGVIDCTVDGIDYTHLFYDLPMYTYDLTVAKVKYFDDSIIRELVLIPRVDPGIYYSTGKYGEMYIHSGPPRLSGDTIVFENYHQVAVKPTLTQATIIMSILKDSAPLHTNKAYITSTEKL